MLILKVLLIKILKFESLYLFVFFIYLVVIVGYFFKLIKFNLGWVLVNLIIILFLFILIFNIVLLLSKIFELFCFIR